MNLTHHTVFITGGGSGIGLALAEAFLELGNTVIVCGRDRKKLSEATAAHKNLIAIPLDISDDKDVGMVLEKLATAFDGVSILINNAAVNGAFSFTDPAADLSEIERQISINLTATLKLTTRVLPMLLKKPKAAVVNVTSVLMYAPRPAVPIYSATKAGLHAATVALRAQLRGSSVRVFEAIPPTVDTAMTEHVQFYKMSPQACAREIVRGMQKDRYEINIGLGRLMYVFFRLFPGLVQEAMNRYQVNSGKKS